MDRQSFTDLIQTKFKMVRIEVAIRKILWLKQLAFQKTLVQIEKERVLPNWTTCVSICALFRDSDVLNNTFGCDPLEIVQTISRNHCAYPNHSTTSDIYWNTIETRNGFMLQSNKVSNIYRVLNSEKQPIFGTSKLREAETYFNRNAKRRINARLIVVKIL